jgi:hypothetical protein
VPNGIDGIQAVFGVLAQSALRNALIFQDVCAAPVMDVIRSC